MEYYKLNLADKTLTVSKAFEDAVAKGNTAESKLLNKLLKDIPGLEILHKTHSTPKFYVNKNGEVTQRNQFKNLKYVNMEQFMSGLPDNEKYFTEYRYLREHASKPQHSQYALVRKWFIAQFPLFRNNPLFYLNNSPELIPAKEIENAVPEKENEVA